jgi:hypothetical protein
MKYAERPEFPYDPLVFKKSDTQTALKIYDEAVRKHGPKPDPTFYEVDRSAENLDPLWNVPMGGRETVSRKFSLPVLNHFSKNEWTMTKVGMIPQRRDDFTVSHLSLIRLDWFPIRGDLVVFNGYRYMVIDVSIPGDAYWHQTNVWLGLALRCIVPPEGDGKPMLPSVEELRSFNVPSVDSTVVQSPPNVPGSQPV